MMGLIQSGLSIFGLFDMNPAMAAFLIIIILFGGMNLLEYKRFD